MPNPLFAGRLVVECRASGAAYLCEAEGRSAAGHLRVQRRTSAASRCRRDPRWSVRGAAARSATVILIADDPFQTALATVARDAFDLLGSLVWTRIKACGHSSCRILFLDMSRSSRRQKETPFEH